MGDGLTYLAAKSKKTGRKWWQARIVYTDPKTGKSRERKATFQGDSKDIAIRMRSDLAVEAKSGQAQAAKDRHRFKEASALWFGTIASEGTRTSWGSHLKYIDEALGDHYLDAITTRDLQAYLGSLDHLGLGSVKQRRVVIRHVFKTAKQRGWVEGNPAKDLELPTRKRDQEAAENPQAPKRSLTVDELRLFLDDLRQHEPDLYPLARTQVVLGARFSEVSALTPDDIDWRTGVVHVRRGQYRGVSGKTKGKYARLGALDAGTLALVQEAHAKALAEQWPGADSLVFPRPPGMGSKRGSNHWAIETVGKRYGESWTRLGIAVEATRTHALRRAMIDATREAVSGTLLRLLVGHTDERMTQLYSTAHQAEAARVGQHMGKLLGPGEGPGSPSGPGPETGPL
jgi:integrase